MVSKVGARGPKLVLFGGLAPRYLVADVPKGVEPYTGTTDLDVVIGVAVLGQRGGAKTATPLRQRRGRSLP
jgi:hypothetical protein